MLLPPKVLFAALAILFVLGLEVPRSVEYAPFAVSLVLFGLPHGALDHLVPDRLAGRGATVRSIGAVVLLYAALGGFYLILWFVAPAAAFALFIGLTWFHWGQGDLHALLFLDNAGHLQTPFVRAATVFVRGGLPMLVPLLAHPDVYREVLGSGTALFDTRAGATLDWAFDQTFRVAVGSAFVLVALILMAKEFMAVTPGSRRPWANDTFETVLLAAYFVVMPPILAIGLYFCLWHAPRHIARLSLLNDLSRNALERGQVLPAARTFAWEAAPITLAALAMLIALYFIVPTAGVGIESLLGLYLVLISLLTLPHVVVVSYMDHRQGVWR